MIKNWDIYCQGHQIRTKAIMKGRSQIIYELQVDGVALKHAKVTDGYWPTIHANYYFSNIEKEIEVRFATKIGTILDLGCQIFIDGEYIGIDRHTEYPTLQEASKKIEKGFLSYFFLVGLLRYGFIFSIPFVIQFIQSQNMK
ncbi:hypothetical protein [Chamaesiphon sp. VAR_48_metabat_403]|uniref:hypothetical protein n=1 Tax=Chamaesiphon sp. VAR_48_metabat_403 TaxID=2964700 RepID=UPI00286D826D|nr:hypothetical protein [Chamaesiphon sp. VAR_48_metabat_403]